VRFTADLDWIRWDTTQALFEAPGVPETGLDGDANGDGTVGILDLGQLGDNYGFDRNDGPAVPEPASAALLLVGVGALLKHRRK